MRGGERGHLEGLDCGRGVVSRLTSNERGDCAECDVVTYRMLPPSCTAYSCFDTVMLFGSCTYTAGQGPGGSALLLPGISDAWLTVCTARSMHGGAPYFSRITFLTKV